MKKAAKIFLKLASVFFFLLSIILCVTSLERALLPYNSEGRYFDPQVNVVWDEGSVFVYGFLAAVFFLVSILVLFLQKYIKVEK
ncbi:hypothetical protein K1X76_01305 [bacterium]|nr:hypothetical protein [bacterium]